MARIKHTHLAREKYDDLDLAIRELGTLWVLDKVNAGLVNCAKARVAIRERRERAKKLVDNAAGADNDGSN